MDKLKRWAALAKRLYKSNRDLRETVDALRERAARLRVELNAMESRVQEHQRWREAMEKTLREAERIKAQASGALAMTLEMRLPEACVRVLEQSPGRIDDWQTVPQTVAVAVRRGIVSRTAVRMNLWFDPTSYNHLYANLALHMQDVLRQGAEDVARRMFAGGVTVKMEAKE